MKSIFIFTRDLRLHDNNSLLMALKESDYVIPIFIFNPLQIDDGNKYKSNNCVKFMCECLDELDKELQKNSSRLFIFYDEPENVIENLIKKDNEIRSVYINLDYTPFAKLRDKKIKKVCDKYKIKFYSYEDYLLTGKDKIVNSSNKPYVKFTPFYKQAIKLNIKSVSKLRPKNYKRKKLPK